MTPADRLTRADSLFSLLTHLVADDFAGHPACVEAEPELFFPEVGQTATVAQAKAICGNCEIREACAAYAVRRGEPHGIWGGLTVDERRERRRAAARHAA